MQGDTSGHGFSTVHVTAKVIGRRRRGGVSQSVTRLRPKITHARTHQRDGCFPFQRSTVTNISPGVSISAYRLSVCFLLSSPSWRWNRVQSEQRIDSIKEQSLDESISLIGGADKRMCFNQF
uniref:(northern house mosquito) hypothetical protein n=1 Tax=Culex pipiens TaxID=7175 RepID=A0A8D8NY36_CULPI